MQSDRTVTKTTQKSFQRSLETATHGLVLLSKQTLFLVDHM